MNELCNMYVNGFIRHSKSDFSFFFSKLMLNTSVIFQVEAEPSANKMSNFLMFIHVCCL